MAWKDIDFTLTQGLILGSSLAGVIIGFARLPVYLSEEGVPLAPGQICPWKYIRHAEWLPQPANVMKLRRLDGDIYLDVPLANCDEVEAFVRGRTKFHDSPRETGGETETDI